MLSSLAIERKPIRCSIFSPGSLDRNILVRDSFSDDGLDPLVTARNTGLKKLLQDATTKHHVSAGRGTQSSIGAMPNLSAHAGEPNLPAKELVSGSPKIVELRRLGAILSFREASSDLALTY